MGSTTQIIIKPTSINPTEIILSDADYVKHLDSKELASAIHRLVGALQRG